MVSDLSRCPVDHLRTYMVLMLQACNVLISIWRHCAQKMYTVLVLLMATLLALVHSVVSVNYDIIGISTIGEIFKVFCIITISDVSALIRSSLHLSG